MATIWEKYPAIVTRHDPDSKLGRIYCAIPGILGDETTEYPDPIDPVFDWGWFFLPDIGEEVEIEIVVEDDTGEDVRAQAFVDDPRIRWRGKRFRADEKTLDEGGRQPHELFTSKNYGKRRGFATPQGHVLFFDDTEDDKQITLAWREAPDSANFSQLTFDKDGSAMLLNRQGSILFLNADGGEVMLADEHGNSYSSNDEGIKIIDIFNNSIELRDGVITVLGATDTLVQAGGNVVVEAGSDLRATIGGDLIADVTGDANVIAANANVTCGELVLDGDTVAIAKNADQAGVRGDELSTYLTSRLSVATAFGPSGPSSVPLAAGVELSTVTTLRCSVWSVLLTLALFLWWVR